MAACCGFMALGMLMSGAVHRRRLLAGPYGVYGLTGEQASGYILGWLQQAQVDNPAKARQIGGLASVYSSAAMAGKDPSGQLTQVASYLADVSPKTARTMGKQIKKVGTPAEVAAVTAALAAKGISGGMPWVWVAAGAGSIVLLVTVLLLTRGRR